MSRLREPMSDQGVILAVSLGLIAFSLIGLEPLLKGQSVNWMYPASFAVGVLGLLSLARDRVNERKRTAKTEQEAESAEGQS